MDGRKLSSREKKSVLHYEPSETPSPKRPKGRGRGSGSHGKSPGGGGIGTVGGIRNDELRIKCLPHGGNDEIINHFNTGGIHYGSIDGFRVLTMSEQYYDDVLEGVDDVKQSNLNLKEENAELSKLLSTGKRGKYKKDNYFYSIEKGLKHLLVNVMFPAMKFLPRGWDTWSDTKNSVCEILSGAIKNVPPNIHLPNYWRDIVVPYANQTYVNMRVNLNQRIKAQFCREYTFIFLQIIVS